MRTICVLALALCLLACGDGPSKGKTEPAAAPVNLRVEYYEISKK